MREKEFFEADEHNTYITAKRVNRVKRVDRVKRAKRVDRVNRVNRVNRANRVDRARMYVLCLLESIHYR
jgi:hypothetical protein